MGRLEQAAAILEAAEVWKDLCLVEEGSVLTDRSLWTAENLAHLDRYYVQNLDTGEGDFFSKLKGQLEPAPPEAKQLAAEMLWVMYLMVSSEAMGGKTKRFQIKKVWEWSGEPLPEEHWALGELLSQGVAHPGTAYHTHRWRELLFFITMMQDWKELNPSDRGQLLSDPWHFADWLEKREEVGGRQLRHMLLFLLFPDSFERIATASHKRQIVRAFRQYWGEDPEDFDYSDRIALDREVLRIRERFEEEHPDVEIDFYEPPAVEIWRRPKTPNGPDPDLPSEEEAEGWFAERFGNARVWAMSAGEGARLWGEFLEQGIAAIGWDFLGDASEYPSKDAVRNAISEHVGRENPVMDALAVWQFSREMRVGDVIIAKKGRSPLLGWGRVASEYRYEPDRGEYRHVRSVQWELEGTWELPKERWITTKTLTDFTDYKQWLLWAFRLTEGDETTSPSPKPGGPYTMEEAMEGLFIPQEQFSAILDTLGRRKNVILQGPPGVGKTYIVKRIAWRLIGRKDPAALQMVQFHQSYSYEDFIQGWRPNDSGGFTLRNGVFYEFCRRAEKDPERAHVFIIDEINRGNLSRIFGELMMLIEADKRGPDHAIPLTYSDGGPPFFVPKNIYLLGLMNTADRSLAMVDYALRRRFGFIDLRPAFGTEVFSEYLLEAEVDEGVVALIDDRMLELNWAIREDRKNLGPGFEIGHSYFVPSGDEESLDEGWYRGIIQTEIEPLLREYWFDQPQRVREHMASLLA